MIHGRGQSIRAGLFLGLLALLAGCGGGGGTGSASRGELALTVKWPASTVQDLRPEVQSVVVRLEDEHGGEITTKRMDRRTDLRPPEPTTTVLFSNLRPGTIIVRASAYANGGTAPGPALQVGSKRATIIAGQRVTIVVNTEQTIRSVVISPNPATLTSAQPSQQLTATALNAAGEMLMISGFVWSPTGSPPVDTKVATVDANGLATRVAPGQTTVTVADRVTGITGTGVIIVPGPQLQLTMTADRSTVAPGGPITYTITATNTGLGDATGVEISDTVPIGMSLPIPTITSLHRVDRFMKWDVERLAPGKSVSETLQAVVDPDVADGTVPRNVAQVRSNEVPNPVSSNQVSVTVQGPPVLALVKVADKNDNNPPTPNNPTITYTLTVTNTGGPATNIQIFDPLPPPTILLDIQNNGTLQNGTVVWDVGPVGRGASASVSFHVNVKDFGVAAISNTGQVRSSESPTFVDSNPVVINLPSSQIP